MIERAPRRVTLAALAVLVGGLASCGGSSRSSTPTTAPTTSAPAGSGTTSATSPATTASSATSASTATPTTPGTTVPSIPACRSADFTGQFSVIPGSAGAGHIEARLVLTNHTARTCRTGGYVGVGLVSATGASLPTKVVRDTAIAAATLTVAPGASISALARFSPDIPGPGDSQTGACQPVATHSLVIAPNDTSQISVPGPQSSVCEQGTIDLRALQSGATAGP
jgi:hypothetical protein